MNSVTAIDKLKALHGNVEVINTSLFRVNDNGSRVLYRLKNGTLQRMVDTSNNKSEWERAY